MSLLQTVTGIVDTGRISLPTVLEALVGRVTKERCDERLAWWARKVVADAQMELVVKGGEHAAESEPFVVMSNHQSLHDIPVLFCAIPGRLRMVAKSELFAVPIWGGAMTAAGFVKVDRQNRRQAVGSLRAAATALHEGTRLWVAPEGTRSLTGHLGTFKSGGFHLAMEAGVRILPVSIDGTRFTLPAKGTIVQLGKTVTVTVHPPIDPRAYGPRRRKELMEAVRSAIAAGLPEDAVPPDGSSPPKEAEGSERVQEA